MKSRVKRLVLGLIGVLMVLVAIGVKFGPFVVPGGASSPVVWMLIGILAILVIVLALLAPRRNGND